MAAYLAVNVYLDLVSGSVIMTTLSLASENDVSGDLCGRWWETTRPEAETDPRGERCW